MNTNYFMLILRNLKKNKGFSVINIIGLGIGMAASILIALWIFDELSWDRFHEKSDQIYRLEREFFRNGETSLIPVTSAIYADKIQEEYPQVDKIVRLYKKILKVQLEDGTYIGEKVFFADHSFYDVFSLPIIKGNASDALNEPNTLVLTEKAAKKYFPDQNPINQIINIDVSGNDVSFLVTGVMKDIPRNSHFHFEMLASFSSLKKLGYIRTNSSWNDNKLYTYLLLKDGVNIDEFEQKLQEMVDTYINPARKELLGKSEPVSQLQLKLQPLTSIHFNNNSNWAIEPNQNVRLIYLFSFFSLLILFMASFNYVNLSVAIASKRSLEIGVRKTMGAAKKQLVLQFLAESIILSVIALCVSALIIELTLPMFNRFTGKSISLFSLLNTETLLFVLVIVFVTGFISGIYPAFYLSSYRPIFALKGVEIRGVKKLSLKKILVILQFSISIALIIGAITANIQLRYFHDKPLGFERENILLVNSGGSFVSNHYQAFKNELLRNKKISRVTTSTSIPTLTSFSDNRYSCEANPGEEQYFWTYKVGNDYFSTYQINVLAGDSFANRHLSDLQNKCIINESAAKMLGFKNPAEAIGKMIIHYGYESNVREQIIGVVSNYHVHDLSQEIKPLVHYFDADNKGYISIKYTGTDDDVLEIAELTWKSNFPNIQFSAGFFTHRYDSLYLNEQKIQQLLIAFTVLSVFIACMGLFGLAAYMIQQRIKEIGIRKVFGASGNSIIRLMNREFLKWVIVANVIAWPLAYFLLDEWLSGFYYRITMSFWAFIFSGMIGIIISVITVSFHALKVVNSNPVDALRYE